MTLTQNDFQSIILLVVMVVVYLLLLLVFKGILPYMKQRKYLKGELDRALSEREYKYWNKKLRRLYLDYIPILGKIIKKRLK